MSSNISSDPLAGNSLNSGWSDSTTTRYTYSIPTPPPYISTDLTEKEKLIERLYQEGKINFVELVVLLDKNNVAQSYPTSKPYDPLGGPNWWTTTNPFPLQGPYIAGIDPFVAPNQSCGSL